jgi:hypothetical protein
MNFTPLIGHFGLRVSHEWRDSARHFAKKEKSRNIQTINQTINAYFSSAGI